MMRAAFSLLLLLLLALTGCPKTGEAPSAAPPIDTLVRGLWSGSASKSPLGEQPYAIEFRKEAAGLVAETPPVLGEDVLPPGAYQKFVFPDGIHGAKASFKTAMGKDGLLDGELARDASRSSKTKAIFCEAGNCPSMELRWESLAADKMSFQVWIDEKLHADIHLQFDGEM